VSSDVPTPAYYDGDFFVLNKARKTLSRVHPKTGEVKWTTPRIGSSDFEASPTAADGKVYLINFDGEVTVVDAGDGNILNTVPMEPDQEKGRVRSSIVVSNGQLLVRTNSYLFCIGK
jgi:outer membrane protein assembly factor BamB